MNTTSIKEVANGCAPRWIRRSIVVMATVTLCSCRGPGAGPAAKHAASCPPTQQGALGSAYGPAVPQPVAMPDNRLPLPMTVIGNWAPPGIARPWPQDEYIHDGGDEAPAAQVDAEWRVHGLELEDTIVHYDTLNGCREVKPSNRVHIYAPRFAAVRKVEAVEANLQRMHVAGVDLPERALGHNEALLATTTMQPLQPISEIGSKSANLFIEKQQSGGLIAELRPVIDLGALKTYEDFAIIRYGIMEEADKPRLAESVQAAIVWSKDEGLKVAIERQAAQAVISDQSPQVTYTVDLPGCPKLQVCKVASAHHALPGEIIDFTIRFDNVGEQTMGNITIVDNLTTRLEYLPDSAQSSVKTEFFSQQNEGDSLLLRWEVTEPLKPGQGGLVRFRCKVR